MNVQNRGHFLVFASDGGHLSDEVVSHCCAPPGQPYRNSCKESQLHSLTKPFYYWHLSEEVAIAVRLQANHTGTAVRSHSYKLTKAFYYWRTMHPYGDAKQLLSRRAKSLQHPSKHAGSDLHLIRIGMEAGFVQ